MVERCIRFYNVIAWNYCINWCGNNKYYIINDPLFNYGGTDEPLAALLLAQQGIRLC